MTPMLKIGYDAKRAVKNHTGLGNYSRYVIDAVSGYYPDVECVLYSPFAKVSDRLAPLLDRQNVQLVMAGGAWKHLGAMWRSMEMSTRFADDEIAIFHGLSNELPLNITRTGIPSVVTMHDVIWRKWPRDYSFIDRKIYDNKYGLSAQQATRIIAISEKTKADVIEAFGVDPEKIDVIYQGCAPIFREKLDPEKKAEIRRLYNLPDRYYISVGTIQSRKNQLMAVAGLRALPSDMKLVLVGGKSGVYADELRRYIAKHSLADRVLWLEGIPFAHLPYLYGMAIFSSYTSRYEGFGIPVIESLSVATPVIATTGSCLEEAGGRGAEYVDPDHQEAYDEIAKKLIDNTYYNNKLAQLGLQHIKRFNDRDFAQRTMATYMKALSIVD